MLLCSSSEIYYIMSKLLQEMLIERCFFHILNFCFWRVCIYFAEFTTGAEIEEHLWQLDWEASVTNTHDGLVHAEQVIKSSARADVKVSSQHTYCDVKVLWRDSISITNMYVNKLKLCIWIFFYYFIINYCYMFW